MGLEKKIIISTRAKSGDDDFEAYLADKGAAVYNMPLIEISALEPDASIFSVLKKLSSFGWLIFTSRNGVKYFLSLLDDQKIEYEELSLLKIAVLGKKTAKELELSGLHPYFVSEGRDSGDFIIELQHDNIKENDKVLLVLGDLAGDLIQESISGFSNVSRINVYKTSPAADPDPEIMKLLISDKYDMLAFMSPSALERFIELSDQHELKKNFRIACIGRTTEKAAIDNNLVPLIVPAKPDWLSFAMEIEKYFSLN